MQLGHAIDYSQALEHQAWQNIFQTIDTLDKAIAAPYDTIVAATFTITAQTQRIAKATFEAAVRAAIVAYFMFIEWREPGAIAAILAEVEALEISEGFCFDALDIALEAVDFEPVGGAR